MALACLICWIVFWRWCVWPPLLYSFFSNRKREGFWDDSVRIGSFGRSGGAHCPDLDCRSSQRVLTQVTVDSSTRSSIPEDVTLHRAAVRTSCLVLQISCDSFRLNNQLAVILLSTSGYFKRSIYFRVFDPNPRCISLLHQSCHLLRPFHPPCLVHADMWRGVQIKLSLGDIYHSSVTYPLVG